MATSFTVRSLIIDHGSDSIIIRDENGVVVARYPPTA
jgi:hypothetical protein